MYRTEVIDADAENVKELVDGMLKALWEQDYRLVMTVPVVKQQGQYSNSIVFIFEPRGD